MDRERFQRGLDAYVDAWRTYDPQQIGRLFSADALYRYQPDDEPVVGRDAIVADWLSNPDPPGTYAAAYEPLAIDGDVHVARGVTRYFEADGSQRDEYNNVYVCRFNDSGECTDFTDYWIQGREYRKRQRDELVRRTKAGEL